MRQQDKQHLDAEEEEMLGFFEKRAAAQEQEENERENNVTDAVFNPDDNLKIIGLNMFDSAVSVTWELVVT